MIDFRYHLVSIIAVFLALAIGIVVGSTELRPAVEAGLQKAEGLLKRTNDRLLQDNTALTQQQSVDQAMAQAASGRLLNHLLTGQTVVLITAPNADGQVISGITTALRQSGAKVTGQVALEPQFFDSGSSNQEQLTQLAGSLAPDAGVTLPSQPASSPVGAQQEAAQVIAAAVVAKNGVGIAAAQSHAVLSGFGQGGYLQISGAAGGSAATLAPASMAVVVAPSSAPTSNDSSPDNLALIAMAQQLQSASHQTVLIGSQAGSGPGSAIDAAAGSGKFSTVDDADLTTGQIITVQALYELLAGHAPASYGVGPGVVPSPAPTPSVSPTNESARHVRKR